MYPALAEFAGFILHSYPVVILFAAVISSFLMAAECRKRRLDIKFLNDYFLSFVIVTALFSRLGGVLENLTYYLNNPLYIFYLHDSNYSFEFGLLGLLISLFAICKLKRELYAKWLDAISLPFLSFSMGISLADFFSGANYGTPSDLSWAMIFNIPEIRYTIPIHPVQLYEFILFLIVFVIFYFYRPKRNEGLTFSYILLLYVMIESFLSMWRGGIETQIMGFSSSLIYNITLASIAVIAIVWLKYPKK